MCAVWNWWRTAGLSLATCVAAPTSSVWSVVFAPDGKSICVGTRAGPQLVPTPPPKLLPPPPPPPAAEGQTPAAPQAEPQKPDGANAEPPPSAAPQPEAATSAASQPEPPKP